jgi:hypothetical protein
VSITHVDLTADEAIKELKAAKVVEQNAIAILQTDRWPHISQTAREQSIAGHRRPPRSAAHGNRSAGAAMTFEWIATRILPGLLLIAAVCVTTLLLAVTYRVVVLLVVEGLPR